MTTSPPAGRGDLTACCDDVCGPRSGDRCRVLPLARAPDIAESTGATQTELTWVVNVYALAFAALLLPIGIAADRLGRRPCLVASLALFAVASLASGLVDRPGSAIRVR